MFFYNKIHILCNLKIIDSNYNVESFPDIYNNMNFVCIQHFQISEKIELRIKIYKKEIDYKFLFTYNYFNNCNNLFTHLNNEDNYKFSPSFLYNEYMKLLNEVESKNLALKHLYLQKPLNYSKIKNEEEENKWLFKNIYNKYYCFCKGIFCEKHKHSQTYQYCKYLFYITIIDNNKNLYEKTEYLFADFIGPNYNSDDTFPIFRRMIKQNMNAHYITLNNDIYNKYCSDKKNCWTIIREEFIDGDFLEKYLYLILKLKIAAAGSNFPSFCHLFTDIEYITNIHVGHGVKFFKSFLYKNHTSQKNYNKLVLAPSTKLISIAKKYGWKEKNIIKICLPKWDKYNNILDKGKIHEHSIFIFFTFRQFKNGISLIQNKKVGISKYYINNILNLLNNTKLNKSLNKNNITLFFGLHQMLNPLKEYIKEKFPFVKIIKNNLISDCLMNSSLLVTDFSSVAFDFIYQKKPVIIYIPDYEDPNIKDLYSDEYFNIIKSLGNKTIYFENQFYQSKDVANKILFYINNKFKLEKNIDKFYDSFEFKCKKNNIQYFIDYIKNLK